MNINNDLKELAQFKMLREEVDKSIKEIEEKLKKYMLDNEIDSIIGVEHKITYKEYISHSFNTSQFKNEHFQLYEKYLKEIKTKRFIFK